jgi:hypothetical protein
MTDKRIISAVGVLLAMGISLHAPWILAQAAGPAPVVDAEKSPTWRDGPSMPQGTFMAAASRSGNFAVITGGVGQTGVALDVAQVFNFRTGAWNVYPGLGGRCMHAQVTLDDGRVFVFGGRTGSVPGNLKGVGTGAVLDPSTGTVTEVPPLPVTLDEPTIHLLPNGRAIVIGDKRASVYDPIRNAWVEHIQLRSKRTTHASAVMDDGRVIVVGGVHSPSIEVIDLKRGVSRQLAVGLSLTLDDLEVVALPGQRAWVIGGQNSRTGETVGDTFIIDLSGRKSELEPGPNLGVPGGMADHAVVDLPHHMVVIGGEAEVAGHDTEHNIALLLDKRTLRVTRLPDMAVPHDDTVAVLDDGKVHVFGGYRTTDARGLSLLIPIAETRVEVLQLPADVLQPAAD